MKSEGDIYQTAIALSHDFLNTYLPQKEVT